MAAVGHWPSGAGIFDVDHFDVVLLDEAVDGILQARAVQRISAIGQRNNFDFDFIHDRKELRQGVEAPCLRLLIFQLSGFVADRGLRTCFWCPPV